MMKYTRLSLIYVTSFGMEACWLFAILNSTNKSVESVLSIPTLLIVLLVSWGISVVLKRLRWPKAALTALSWIIWPAVMLLMIKFQLFRSVSFWDSTWISSLPHAFGQIFYKFEAPLLVFLSTAVLWWLGRRLAYLKAGFSATITELQLGLIMLAVIFFINYEVNLDQSGLTSLAITFFFLALLGVSISHAQDGSWFFSAQKGSWFTIVLICIGIILVSGLVVSFIFTPDLIQLLIQAIKWIWGQIEMILAWIASLFPPSAGDPGILPPAPTVPPVNEDGGQVFKLPEWLRPGLTLAWEILVGGLLLIAIWRIASEVFGWLRRQLPSGADEVESLKGAFKTDLIKFLKRLISAIFRIKFKIRDDSLKNMSPEIASTRQIYAQFLRWAAAGGHPRDKSVTPEEYRFRLTLFKPECEEDLEFITREYMNVRYGSSIPAKENLNLLREKWQNLKKKGFKKSKG